MIRRGCGHLLRIQIRERVNDCFLSCLPAQNSACVSSRLLSLILGSTLRTQVSTPQLVVPSLWNEGQKSETQPKILRKMRLPSSGMETEGKVGSDYPRQGSHCWSFEGRGARWTSCQDNLLLGQGQSGQGYGRPVAAPAPAPVPGSLPWGQRLFGMWSQIHRGS